MGNKNYCSYEYQKKAIKEGKISFELNLYFIGEDIYPLYENMKRIKQRDKGEIYDYWNYYFHQGNYEKQLEEIEKIFKKRKESFKTDPKNIFKEVILIKMNKKDDDKIKQIFDIFAYEQDVYCPFIIFLLNKQITPNGKDENIVPDNEEYYISPFKVLTFNFQKYDAEETMKLYKRLWRICSYYNELGDQFILWPKNNDDSPYPYDLINSNFSSYINIFCLGKTGSGKSTFLNKFFNEKRSKQGGTGKSTTTKIVRYGIDGIPIRIYDIPGFEGKETIEIVNKKLIETTKEMYNDNDRIHLILYFINYNVETYFEKMEDTIINTLKKNNNEVKIIFVLTHCPIDPYNKENLKKKKKKDALNDKINKFINLVGAIFGKKYSIEENYFKKDSIIQENVILVNLVKDYINEKEEFGFEKIIERICGIMNEGNSIEHLKSIEKILVDAIVSKKNISPDMEKNIEMLLQKSYLINQTTFALQKEKAILEAQKLYDNMFSIGKTALACCPFIRDLKLGLIKYQKRMFKENLKRIFGFNLKNDTFVEEEMSDLSNINNNYYKNKEIEKENKEKNDVVNEIRKDYHEKEVNSTWIVANEIVGGISYVCMFGGPIGLALGGAGVIGTSYISYNQFKKDCTEYFEQYKKHYEENKYYSLLNFIISTQRGIEFFKNYLEELNNDKNMTDLQGAPIVEGINETIKGELKSMINNNQDIYTNIPVLN
jgi:predicted GTPase